METDVFLKVFLLLFIGRGLSGSRPSLFWLRIYPWFFGRRVGESHRGFSKFAAIVDFLYRGSTLALWMYIRVCVCVIWKRMKHRVEDTKEKTTLARWPDSRILHKDAKAKCTKKFKRMHWTARNYRSFLYLNSYIWAFVQSLAEWDKHLEQILTAK